MVYMIYMNVFFFYLFFIKGFLYCQFVLIDRIKVLLIMNFVIKSFKCIFCFYNRVLLYR